MYLHMKIFAGCKFLWLETHPQNTQFILLQNVALYSAYVHAYAM